MPVSTFVAKADALKSKGPFALFSGDLKLLTNQVKADFKQILTEHAAAKKANRPTAFCPPQGSSIKLTDKDIMGAMQAVPPAQRARTDSKDALRGLLVRRFPCAA
jgi:hypothetical protein